MTQVEEQEGQPEDREDQKLEPAANEDAEDNNEDVKSDNQSENSEELDIYKIYSEGEPANPVALTDPDFVDIARIEPGGSFGALSLIQGKKRMGTTKALTRCHLLVLNKNDWKESEKEIQERKIADKVAFIKQIPLFSKLSHTFLAQKLMPNFYRFDCHRDHYVYKEGEPADKVYIITEGEFICTK